METMRRIVMFERVTADGCFSGADGNLDWVVPEEQLDKAAASSLPGSDTILFGRRTYELFRSFWPQVSVDARGSAPDPHGGGRSQEIGALATWINQATKLVFSRTLKDVGWSHSRLVRELDPRELEAMKRQPGKDIMIFGSGSIVSELTRHGLIDEYQLVVCPVLLGSGRPLMGGLGGLRTLRLVEARPYPSGNVRLRYERA